MDRQLYFAFVALVMVVALLIVISFQWGARRLLSLWGRTFVSCGCTDGRDSESGPATRGTATDSTSRETGNRSSVISRATGNRSSTCGNRSSTCRHVPKDLHAGNGPACLSRPRMFVAAPHACGGPARLWRPCAGLLPPRIPTSCSSVRRGTGDRATCDGWASGRTIISSVLSRGRSMLDAARSPRRFVTGRDTSSRGAGTGAQIFLIAHTAR